MVKRYGHLFPSLITFENLCRAYRKAAKGKRGQPNVAAFEFHLEDNLFQLQEELATGLYCPGPYTSFYIYDPKHRLISAAPFRDRVVHHALCNVIEPIFERTFIGDSYANRKGKGTHAALDRAQAFARRYRYVLQCDLDDFLLFFGFQPTIVGVDEGNTGKVSGLGDIACGAVLWCTAHLAAPAA